MTSRDFCYWLQGMFEIADPDTLNAEAVAKIKAHLNMVFLHEIDPSMGDKEHQDKLQTIHDAPSVYPNFSPSYPDGHFSPGGPKLKC